MAPVGTGSFGNESVYLHSGGGGAIVFPDNTRFLKRLHAGMRMKNGKMAACGCCVEWINRKLSPDAITLGPATGTVHVRIVGYFRKSGNEFQEYLDFPIETVKEMKSESKQAPGTEPRI